MGAIAELQRCNGSDDVTLAVMDLVAMSAIYYLTKIQGDETDILAIFKPTHHSVGAIRELQRCNGLHDVELAVMDLVAVLIYYLRNIKGDETDISANFYPLITLWGQSENYSDAMGSDDVALAVMDLVVVLIY